MSRMGENFGWVWRTGFSSSLIIDGLTPGVIRGRLLFEYRVVSTAYAQKTDASIPRKQEILPDAGQAPGNRPVIRLSFTNPSAGFSR